MIYSIRSSFTSKELSPVITVLINGLVVAGYVLLLLFLLGYIDPSVVVLGK